MAGRAPEVGSTAPHEAELALDQIADFVSDYEIASAKAFEIARHCLMDALARAFRALSFPACFNLLGPVVPGATMPGGSRVPGTSFELEPIQGAFNVGTMMRWSECEVALPAPEWGQPRDSLGAILAVADYSSRRSVALGEKPLLVRDVLAAMIKAYEIQGAFASERFEEAARIRASLVASTAVAAQLLTASRPHVLRAISNASIDGGSHCWPAGDTASRAVRLALISLTDTAEQPRGAAGLESLSRVDGSRMIESIPAARVRAEKSFVSSILNLFPPEQCSALSRTFSDREVLERTPVNELVALMVKNT